MSGRVDWGSHEVDADEFMPYLHHIGPQVVALNDGSIMAMAVISGLAFELDSHTTRNARPNRVNSFLQLISDDNVTVHVNFVRGDAPPDLVGGSFQTNFAEDTYNKYARKTFGDIIKENTWVLSVIVHPRIYFEGTFKRLKRQYWAPELSISEESERQLEDIMEVAGIWLARYGFRRLGYRQGSGRYTGVTYTEIGEALALVLTTQRRTVPMSNGTLGGAAYTDHVGFGHWRGRHALTIERVDKAVFGVIWGFKHYPNTTLVGMFNELMATEYPLVMTHSGRFLNRTTAETRMRLKEVQMANASDKAVSLVAGLMELQDQVSSNRVVMMSHHFSLAVYADNKPDLARRASQVSNLISVCGATVVRETRGNMAAYFSQLPGARVAYQCRPGAASSRNFAKFVSLEAFPQGETEGYWGDPVIQFKTNGGTVYNHHLHVGEIGHTGLFGWTGSGKTLMLSFIICCLQRTFRPSDTLICLDKDQGMQCTVLANGGSYVVLRRGTASGSAPLQVYDDTPRNTGHLAALYKRLIMLDGLGPILPGEDDMLHRGVSRQLKLPKPLRSMLGVKAFLGSDPRGAGARFAKWCRGGPYGWLFDNDVDLISIEGHVRLAGFDFTDLLPKDEAPDDGCAAAMASDIMFRLKAKMDGRRFGIVVDECRYYMDSISGMIEDFALTGRKKELALILAAQKPDHVLAHPLGRSIMAQVPNSFCFPDEKAEWKEYGARGLGCTPAEFNFIKSLDTITKSGASQSKRQILIRRQAGSVIVEFDITGMDDEIAILSGRPDTAALMERIAAELGPDATPDNLVAEFKARWRSLHRIVRKTKILEEELV